MMEVLIDYDIVSTVEHRLIFKRIDKIIQAPLKTEVAHEAANIICSTRKN